MIDVENYCFIVDLYLFFQFFDVHFCIFLILKNEYVELNEKFKNDSFNIFSNYCIVENI